MGANQSASVGGVGGPGAIASASSESGDAAIPIVRGTPESEATVPMSALGGPRISSVPMPVGRVVAAVDLPLARIVMRAGESGRRAASRPRALEQRRGDIYPRGAGRREDTWRRCGRQSRSRGGGLLTQATELRIHRLQLGRAAPSAACASTASPRGRASSSRARGRGLALTFFTGCARRCWRPAPDVPAVPPGGRRDCAAARDRRLARVVVCLLRPGRQRTALAPAGGRRARLAVSD